jgi:hypothetical protein
LDFEEKSPALRAMLIDALVGASLEKASDKSDDRSSRAKERDR